MAATDDWSAVAILRTTGSLPVLDAASQDPSSVRSPWGKGAKRWRAAVNPPLEGAEWPVESEPLPAELGTLIAASFDVFMRLQRSSVDAEAREAMAWIIARASREYREALQTSIFAAEDRLERDQLESDEVEVEFADLLKVSLAIWHLCELLFLQRRPREDPLIAYDIASWLQEHYASARLDQLETTSLRLKQISGRAVEKEAEFWPTLHGLVMMGCGSSAWTLLASHSSCKSLFARDVASVTSASTRTSFQSIQELLLCMPAKRVAHGTPLNDTMDWKTWHDACEHLLATDTLVKSNPDLRTLIQIMIAHEDVLTTQANTWFELMMARLLFEEPKRVAHRMEFLMAKCYSVYYGESADAMNNFDCIIMALLQYDIQSALQDIHSMGFSWMAAHLADLLTKSHVIADAMPEESLGCSLSEFFLLQYTMEIGACSGMWQIAVGYYESCASFGARAIQATLEREPVPTDDKTDRLLAVCQGKLRSIQIQRGIVNRRAEECKRTRSYGSALQWLLRAKLLDDVDEVCDLIIEDCERSQSLVPLNEAVEFLEGHREMAQTARLLWLVNYREFNLVLEDRQSLKDQLTIAMNEDSSSKSTLVKQIHFVSHEAAKRLHVLLSSTAAPKRLRAVLLRKVEDLLTASPTVFSARHLHSVVAYLRTLDRSFDRDEFYASTANLHLKERIHSLIARNLSEAILAEGGCTSSLEYGHKDPLRLAGATNALSVAMEE